MKILHLTPAYFPAVGGVETHVKELNVALIKKGHQVTVLTLAPSTINVSLYETVEGVEVVRCLVPTNLKGRKFKLHVWQWIWKNRQLLLEADVIQVHDVFWWLLPVLLMVEDKVFTTFHGWEGHYPVRWQAKLVRLIANVLSVRTIHVGGWIQDFYWDKPTLVTYGGVSETEVCKTTTKKEVIAFIGRLSMENEVEKYLLLFSELKKTAPGLEIIWIGDGPLASLCKKMGKVTGMVSNPETFLASSTLVFASSYLSILNAQKQGKVVCAFYSQPLKKSYLTAIPTADTMLIESDVLQMKNQVQTLLTDSKSRQFMEKKAIESARRMTWKKVAELYLKLWQN